MSDEGAPFVSHAYKGVLSLCGSLVALSLALAVLGFDLRPLVNAWEQSIIHEIQHHDNCAVKDETLGQLIIDVESLKYSHLSRKIE